VLTPPPARPPLQIPAIGLSFLVERLVRSAVENCGKQRRAAAPAAVPQLAAPVAVQDAAPAPAPQLAAPVAVQSKALSVQPLVACAAMEE
jgi:hypothetical protein